MAIRPLGAPFKQEKPAFNINLISGHPQNLGNFRWGEGAGNPCWRWHSCLTTMGVNEKSHLAVA